MSVNKKIPPLIVKDWEGRLDPRYHGKSTQIPAKLISNTRGSMDLLDLYAKGALKFENTGKVCRECVNYYSDAQSRYGGRCKARGFMETHPDTPADERPKGWTHPVEGVSFPYWPACPLYESKTRLSRR